jgi:hypothetical protein
MLTATVDLAVRTAVVRAADGVRFTATASDDEALLPRVVEYVASRCDDVLWPEASREVRRLIADHRESDAIAAYFRNVGLRWDEEWLELRAADAGALSAFGSGHGRRASAPASGRRPVPEPDCPEPSRQP